MIVSLRLITMIGLSANVIGAILIAKYDMLAGILVIEETPSHLKMKKMSKIGWFFFISGFIIQMIALAIDA